MLEAATEPISNQKQVTVDVHASAMNKNPQRPQPRDHFRLHSSAVDVVAQSLPWTSAITESATTALALDAEYRVREIVQESIKYMKHSKRAFLTPHDINAALRLRDVAPVYGFGGTRFAKRRRIETCSTHPSFPNAHQTNGNAPSHRFQPVDGNEGLFFSEDKEVSIRSILESNPPKLPLRTSVSAHWLAVDCSQPTTHQNPPKLLDSLIKPQSTPTPTAPRHHTPGLEVKPVVRHDLSLELQLYFQQITAAVAATDLHHLETCLSSVTIQTGLEQMLPYLTQFIFRTVRESKQDLHVLFSTMRLTHAILSNPAFKVDPYLQQLLPAVVTCVVGKRLCSDPWENHWALREYAAKVAHGILERYGKTYSSLRPRFTATLENALKDLKRPLTTHYGAIVGLASFGSQVVKLYLLPKFEEYSKKLRALLDNPSTKPIRRLEGAKVVGAILWAASLSKSLGSPLSGETENDSFSPDDVIKTLKDDERRLRRGLGSKLFPYEESLPESTIAKGILNRDQLKLDWTSDE